MPHTCMYTTHMHVCYTHIHMQQTSQQTRETVLGKWPLTAQVCEQNPASCDSDGKSTVQLVGTVPFSSSQVRGGVAASWN